MAVAVERLKTYGSAPVATVYDFQAELALRKMGTPSLLVALDYLALLDEQTPERFQPAAVRRHGRLQLEAPTLTLTESQVRAHRSGDARRRSAGRGQLLRTLLMRVRPTLVPRIG